MAKKIELIFKNELGKNVTLSLDTPIEPVDPVQVALVMDQVITEGVFISSGGALISKYAARVVERKVFDIEV